MSDKVLDTSHKIVQVLRELTSNIDVDFALVGGALRDRTFNMNTGSNLEVKDFDFILLGDASFHFYELYQAFRDGENVKLKRYVDSYHSPRLARRGLSGVFMLEVAGYDVDILLYEEGMDYTTVEDEIRKFDMDVNQAAYFFDGVIIMSKAFVDAHGQRTFKIVDREQTEDGGFSAREMQRLMKIQNKLTGYEMLDFPEFMERLDYFGGLDAAMQASKPVAVLQGISPDSFQDNNDVPFK